MIQKKETRVISANESSESSTLTQEHSPMYTLLSNQIPQGTITLYNELYLL